MFHRLLLLNVRIYIIMIIIKLDNKKFILNITEEIEIIII